MAENNHSDDFNRLEFENEVLLKRLRHLLQSDFIRSFDMKNPSTGEYERDIKDADKFNEEKDVLFVCDRRKCMRCSEECNHTHDVRHARNFELFPGSTNKFYEVERT